MKTHHESYNLASSVKERVTVKDTHLISVQEPDADYQNIPNPKEYDLMREVHSKINYYDLKPMILTR